MILKEFLELRRDRRTMALIVALPLVLLVVFGYAANFHVTHVPTRVVGPGAEQVASQLKDPFDVKQIDPSGTEQDGRNALRSQDAGAVVVTTDTAGPATVLVDGSNLFSGQSAAAAAQAANGKLKPDVLFNPGLKTSWVMVPALVGMIMAFIGTIITAIGLVRERQAGTLEQLAVMPFKASDVIAGKIAPYFVLAAFDMILVTVLGCLLFGVPFAGNVLVLALGAALFLFTVLGIGVLISTVSQNQGQAMQMALMTMMPQMLLSGMIFPLSAMAAGVRWIGYLFPLTYFNMISNGIMLRNAPMSSLALPLGVLAGMAVLVFTAAVLRFRRDLAPSAPKASAPRTSCRADRDRGERPMSTAYQATSHDSDPDSHGAWGLHEVTVAFGTTTALHGITLAAVPGQVSAVVGGDGAGKTSLLRTLVGRIRPQSGQVTAPPTVDCGFMPTGASGVWQDLTVAENIDFVAAAHHLAGTAFDQRRAKLLGTTGLDRARDRQAGALSGGMRQKLAFCLAILHEPRLLVLDEPSTGVDPVSRVDLWRLVSRAAADGTAVAMATTYLDEAERATTCLVLDRGRALASGAPADVLAHTPGTVTSGESPSGPPGLSWRRGRQTRSWHPGPAREGEQPITADMEDSVIAFTLADQQAGRQRES